MRYTIHQVLINLVSDAFFALGLFAFGRITACFVNSHFALGCTGQ